MQFFEIISYFGAILSVVAFIISWRLGFRSNRRITEAQRVVEPQADGRIFEQVRLYRSNKEYGAAETESLNAAEFGGTIGDIKVLRAGLPAEVQAIAKKACQEMDSYIATSHRD